MDKEYNLFLENDILELEGIDFTRDKVWDKYIYDGHGVPRVTKIIAQCQNSDYLIQWAANIGRRKYDYYREKALSVGTIVHESIDNYLIAKYHNNTGYAVDYDNIPDDQKSSVYNAYENFKVWERKLNSLGYYIEEVVGLEIPIVTPWFGGTIDAIFKINGLYYVIDFKTSKSISNEYIVQVCAYMWGINNGYANLPHIDGIGIIRVDKTKHDTFDDLFINEHTVEGFNIINKAQLAFGAYLESYYRTVNLNTLAGRYSSNYHMGGAF